MKIRSDSSFMMRGERSYLRQRGLRRKTVFSLSCPTEGVVVINMKNILRQKVSAGIFGASLLGSLFFGGAAQAADDLTVLTSFGIIEDITRNIAGDKAKVKVIVPTGSDPHAYNLSASNMIDMEKSSLIVINGLSFEGYLERYLTQDKYAHKIVVASAGVEEQEFVEEHHAEKSADEHEHDDHDNDEHEHGDCCNGDEGQESQNHDSGTEDLNEESHEDHDAEGDCCQGNDKEPLQSKVPEKDDEPELLQSKAPRNCCDGDDDHNDVDESDHKGCGCGCHGKDGKTHDHKGCGCGCHGKDGKDHDHKGCGCGCHGKDGKTHDHKGCGCGCHGKDAKAHDHKGCGCGCHGKDGKAHDHKGCGCGCHGKDAKAHDHKGCGCGCHGKDGKAHDHKGCGCGCHGKDGKAHDHKGCGCGCGCEEHGHHHHHHSGTDPHAWQNPLNGALYARNIADALCKADEADCEYFKKRADGYIAELKALDNKYRKLLAGVPQENRVIITTHDAFGYLARHYDLRILSPFGLSTGSEPSAKRIAELKDIISRGVVKAVFMEKNGNNTILDQLAGDRKIKNVELYADTLAPEGECSTYVGILNHNLDAIVGAISVSGK